MGSLLNNITLKLEKFRNVILAREELDFSLETLDEMIQDSKEPLLVMVMGEFSTGKSTFINALVGEEIAAVNATPTTAVITKLCYGESNKVIIHYKDGSQEENTDIDFASLTAENKVEFQRHDEISYVERQMPLDMLNSMSIIDSPGLNSINQGHTAATRVFMDKADTVLWMFDANKPVSQTEIAAMSRLNARLEPIAIINKMDALNDDEDDENVFLEGIRQKLKDKVRKVIGISAKLAFQGKKNGNKKQLEASNLQEFYDTLNELVLPHIEKYKMNTLMDDMVGYISEIHNQIDVGESLLEGLQDEDYESYVEERQKQMGLRDGLDDLLKPLYEYAVTQKKSATAQTFLAVLYQYGYLVEKDEKLAERMFEEAALRNDTFAQGMLVIIYCLNKEKFDKGLYWLRKLDEHDDPTAQYLLGLLYEKGLGVKENAKGAVKYYEKSANQECGEGLYQLAECYWSGYGVNKDKNKAIELLERAVKVGNEDAMVALANLYKNGEMISKDEKKAFELYEKAAKKGDADGQLNLAYCYNLGIGTKKDIEKSVFWFRRAALQDNAEAQYFLGLSYNSGVAGEENTAKAMLWLNRAADNGDGNAMMELSKIEQDEEKSFEWLQKAVDAENDEAMYVLGMLYEKGGRIQQDYLEAVKWYKKAAEAENIEAMYALGSCYEFGKGVQQHYVKAKKWYSKAVEGGDSYAMVALGRLYEYGCQGIQQDYKRAEQWYLKAAETNNEVAMWRLGTLYENGDYSKALKWYRKAAEAGSGEAMAAIGKLYKYGKGVKRNFEEEIKWYEKAANLGNATAMCNLGYLYEHGEGVQQNYEAAIKWYEQAANLGNTVAMCNLGYAYETGEGVQQNYEEAVKWYEQAANLGDTVAMCYLGYAYETGEGVQQNYEEAVKWFEQGAKLGDATAMCNLGYAYEHGEGVQQNYEEHSCNGLK